MVARTFDANWQYSQDGDTWRCLLYLATFQKISIFVGVILIHNSLDITKLSYNTFLDRISLLEIIVDTFLLRL